MKNQLSRCMEKLQGLYPKALQLFILSLVTGHWTASEKPQAEEPFRNEKL